MGFMFVANCGGFGVCFWRRGVAAVVFTCRLVNLECKTSDLAREVIEQMSFAILKFGCGLEKILVRFRNCFGNNLNPLVK